MLCVVVFCVDGCVCVCFRVAHVFPLFLVCVWLSCFVFVLACVCALAGWPCCFCLVCVFVFV